MPGRLAVRWLRHGLSLIVVALSLGGCAGLRSAATELVTVQSSTSTRYYPVRGSTTRAIFDAIDEEGLTDAAGRRAVGLTTGHWSIDIRTVQDHGSLSCNTALVRINLDLVMTLPQFEQAHLSTALQAKWARFAARVAAHEQRHVEIYLDGARRMETRMEHALAAPGPCAGLQAAVQKVWTSQ